MKKQTVLLTAIFFAVSMVMVGCKAEVHSHTYSEVWTYDASGHWHAATCEHTEEKSGFAEHSYDEWKIVQAATEEAEGSKERTCSVCPHKEKAVIAKLEHTHTYSEAWTYDTSGHWHAATCGHTEEKADYAEHSFGEYVLNNDATFDKDGTKIRTCEECGYEETGVDEGSKLSVLIPAGSFKMGSEEGSSENQPVHEVTITKPFYMGKYEVTQAEYEVYCSYGRGSPSEKYGVGDNYPAYNVSWYDALVYCNKRSMAEGLTPCYSISDSPDPEDWGDVPTSSNGTWDSVECNWNANGYRLPTEAEWEYAARAGDNTVDSLTYSGTSDVNKLGDYAWYYGSLLSAYGNTYEVGTKLPNAFGLYDMSGNVWEWCWNWFTIRYDTTTEGGSDPTGSSSRFNNRLCRGGGWRDGSYRCAVSFRGNFNFSSETQGFRVVRSSSN